MLLGAKGIATRSKDATRDHRRAMYSPPGLGRAKAAMGMDGPNVSKPMFI